ncbi:MAG: hypothetical protein AB7U97_28205, partial [Pirellulales bacterium]
MAANHLTGNRRDFFRASAGIVAGAALAGSAEPALASIEAGGGRKLFKAAKWDMIQIDVSIADKFALQKELGFDGMELISPSDLDPAEVRAASEKTGMPVH